jgi:TolB protein
MRLFAILLLCLASGCAVTRNITIDTRPAGARIEIDGFQQAANTHVFTLTWESDEVHNISAELAGYVPKPVQLRRDDQRSEVTVELKPLTRAFTVNVGPVPALIKINGRAIDNDFHTTYSTPDMDVSCDPLTHKWKEYTVTAEREGFKTATATMKYADNKSTYELNLSPVDKDFAVTTDPPGAQLFFEPGDDPLGTSPIDKVTREFQYDVNNNQYVQHKLKATLAGYPPQEQDISYDDGKASYKINFEPSTKTFRIHTKPPGGVVTLEGQKYKLDANGDTTIKLAFPPLTPGTNDLKTYSGDIAKPKTADQEWDPLPIAVKWDGGQLEYTYALHEIKTVKMPMLAVGIERGDTAWQILPKATEIVAGKSRQEPDGLQPVSLTPAEVKGKNIDSLAISPDGKKLLFTVLEDKPTLHSVMYLMPSDGSAPPMPLDDGNSLDITPSFSPDGEQILFASDRPGNRLILCGISASGDRGIQQYTIGQTTDWWPTMDSSPKPRVFYEARSDRLRSPSIYSKLLDTSLPVDLNIDGGMRPRINTQNDSVVYERYNDRTQKRDIWRMSDSGGGRVNLTNSPDDDDYDAEWDRVGARIAYASDAGVDEDKNHNYDIWVLDLTQTGAQPQRITSNPSHDDHPVWDPSGKAIYFRSNRGGEWGIWKIDVK